MLLSTGGGKSLCYQLPAIWWRRQGGGPTLVISPLIALMEDQVRGLRARGIGAAALHSQLDELAQRAVWADLTTGRLDLIYAAPERCALPSFQRLLQRLGVAAIAVDEAHCISQWGHDFRPDYRLLAPLCRALGAPVMALTATASARVQDEIVRDLGLSQAHRLRGPFVRPNLHFAVRPGLAAAARLVQLQALLGQLSAVGADRAGRAIVYCSSRRRVEAVAAVLRGGGLAVGAYHAGQTAHRRRRAQAAYDAGETPILVATCAFGMGIDHPDVRLVVHLQAPSSLAAYYQEAGRAGRDGAIARCLLFWGRGDAAWQRLGRATDTAVGRRARADEAAAMAAYATAQGGCRQALLAAHFDAGGQPACGHCDLCQPPSAALAGRPLSPAAPPTLPLEAAAATAILAAMASLKRPVGQATLAQALCGSQAKRLRSLGLLAWEGHGCLRGRPLPAVQATLAALLKAGALEPRGRRYPTVWLAGRPVRQARQVGGGDPAAATAAGRAALGAPAAAAAASARGRRTAARRPRSGGLEAAFLGFARRQGRLLGWRPYMVLNRATCRALVAAAPVSLWALTQVPGMGPAKVERFGVALLTLVAKHAATPL